MQLVAIFPLLFSLSAAGLIERTTPSAPLEENEGCELVQLSECSVSCNGGYQLFHFACTDPAQRCNCITNPVYYQCNNRPCLSQNATLLDIFYDAEDQQEAESSVEYYEDDGTGTVAPKKTRKQKTTASPLE